MAWRSVVVLGWLAALPAVAASRVELQAEAIESAGLQLAGVRLTWTGIAGAAGTIGIAARRVAGLGAAGALAGVTIDCAELRISGDRIDCARGRLGGELGRLGQQQATFRLGADAAGRIDIDFGGVALAGGRAHGRARLAGPAWECVTEVTDFDLAAAAALARPWFALPQDLTVAGQATAGLRARGRARRPQHLELALALARLDLANGAGTIATEGLAGELRLAADFDRHGAATLAGAVRLPSGQAYAEPVFVDFTRQPADLDFRGVLAAAAPRLAVDEFTLRQPGVVELGGSVELDLAGTPPVRRAQVRISSLEVGAALPVWVQPFLIATPFKDLAGAGRISGELELADGWPTRAALTLTGITLDSTGGSFGVSGLAGELRWYDDAARGELAGELDNASFHSYLDWQSARLWGIEFGAVTLPFAAAGRHFRLLEPVVLPVFDGGLAIETLRLRHAGTPQMYLRFDAALRPVSVGRIARAFGWPAFDGTLAGRIPNLQFAGGEVTLGGNLEAQVFDGSIVVRNLRLRDPLGRFPRLYADIDIERLDLEQVTNTFSFGMITGRLSGRIARLETFAWMPEAFDARLYTTPGDRTPRRISQRAVTNLSSIGGGSGGGVAAALQGGFLRFFETFRYAALGLNCRLANDVCAMSGIERSGGGYYIVKGAGIPRIDVIGSESRVAWTRLVRQLAAMTETGVVVQ